MKGPWYGWWLHNKFLKLECWCIGEHVFCVVFDLFGDDHRRACVRCGHYEKL